VTLQKSFDPDELAEMALFPELNPGPVCRLNKQGTILRANAAAKNAFGEKNFIGSSWFIHCTNVKENTWKQILESDATFPFESAVGERVFLFSYVSRKDHDLVFVFGTDITALKEAERQVYEVARFPDMNPGAVLRMDLGGNVLLNNAAARKVFGHDINGKCWLDIWPSLKNGLWDKILSEEKIIPVEVR
jgi:PAS domain-containing protein